MVLLTTTMTACLGCWHDDFGADYGAVLDWVTSDDESEASYDGDPREAHQDPLNKRAFTDPPEPDPEVFFFSVFFFLFISFNVFQIILYRLT